MAVFDREDSHRKVRGIIRGFETTVGDEHGWRPHYHVFFLVEGTITQAEASAALMPAWDRWCDGLAEHGLSAVATVGGESAGFDVAVMDDADAGAMAKYPFKLALEAVGGVFKRGRAVDGDGNELGKRHRTPFEVMEHIAVGAAEDDDQVRADRAIVREWSETATAMRFRQCPLPPGMRAVFAKLAVEVGVEGSLLEPELSEEEIVEAEVEGTETAGEIGRKAWHPIRCRTAIAAGTPATVALLIKSPASRRPRPTPACGLSGPESGAARAWPLARCGRPAQRSSRRWSLRSETAWPTPGTGRCCCSASPAPCAAASLSASTSKT